MFDITSILHDILLCPKFTVVTAGRSNAFLELVVAVYRLVARMRHKKVCLTNLLDSLKPFKHKANRSTLECEALKFSYTALIWEWSNLISSINSG